MSDKSDKAEMTGATSEALTTIVAGGNDLERFIERVLDGVQSPNTRRAYARAIDAFVKFMAVRREPLSKALLNEFKAQMRADGRGDAAINAALSGVRFFLREASADGLIDQAAADRACRVTNIQTRGTKAGNWLTREQAEKILQAPDTTTALGLRDRAILACLIGGGLRRAECAALTVGHFQQREGRWVIVDLKGKRNKVRSIPVAGWVKAIVDLWLTAAGISSGLVFRQASWAKGKFVVSERGLSDKAIARAVARYGWKAGAPGIAAHDLRRTFAKLAHTGGADLAQIQYSLGHESLETTQKYLGAELSYSDSAADHLGLRVTL